MTGSDFIKLDSDRVTVAKEFADVLRENGLAEFAAMMAHASGTVVRSVPGRSTVRIELRRAGGPPLVAYLKRYEPGYLSPAHRLLRLCGWPAAQDEAWHEWDAMLEVRRLGLHTAKPIAVGQQREGGMVTSSFLLTAEIANGVPADEYVRPLAFPERRAFALELAEVARRFHGAGMVHKDFYLCHVFVTSPDGRRELTLIDFQRVVKPGAWWRQRWVVKDLGALGYAAQLAGSSGTILLRFYLQYRGIRKLTPEDKALIRRVLPRMQALHRRGPKYDIIWDQPGARPEVPNRR